MPDGARRDEIEGDETAGVAQVGELRGVAAQSDVGALEGLSRLEPKRSREDASRCGRAKRPVAG